MLATDIGTAIVAILPLLFIVIAQPVRQPEDTGKETSYWQDLREGFRYVVRWPGLLGITLLAMMLNFLLSPTSALTPLVVTGVFHKGVVELGWTRAVFGAGTIIAGVILSAWGGFRRRIVTSLGGVIGVGLGVVLFGLVPADRFFLLLIASFLQGPAVVFANGPLQAIFQSSIALDVQGRVFSLIGAGAAAMMPLSLLIAGPVADWLGVRFWYIVGGTVCILVTVVASFIPAVVNIERNQVSAESAFAPDE